MAVIVFNDTFYFLIWARFFGSCKGKWNSFSIKYTERNSVTKKKKKKEIVHSSWLVSTFHILRSSSLTDNYSLSNSSRAPLQYLCLENPMDGGAW